ncbi:nitrogenase [Thermoleptolyngbya sichuanensis A183]|uniref:Nitrogenase n=1 Tax=Thermoleptolyngbya sichuanensis A183 TaxID=2737172 RepID=A0A6M8BHY2_9CYAN|nr:MULTISPECIES: Mo-dependent nitrogenase C-terminal domain-containing protein [Thermoleptolyngbya]QKD82753.1 nitrogenase [Thermoleptolyngbya sichuanensis A183]
MATLTRHPSTPLPLHPSTPLAPLRHWIDGVEITNLHVAHRICRLIPCCCPFERDLTVLGHTIHIPALCKLNPVYDELVALRLRALTYLADTCGEDVTRYLC